MRLFPAQSTIRIDYLASDLVLVAMSRFGKPVQEVASLIWDRQQRVYRD